MTGRLGYSMIASLKNATGAYARTLIGNIRNILAGKDVLVTTYTYLPGVGMTGMTEPGGNATSYEYDSSGRLQRIKNMDGRTTEAYLYHTVTGEEAPPEPITTEVTFTNVNYGERRVTAEIVCSDDCEVTFQLEGNIETTGAVVEFYLDDNYYTYSTPIDMPTTINMAAGTRFFEIYLYNTSKTTERASVTITSVNAPNTLGDNLTLSIEH